jgi:wobble nucleotide-excising tRNase
MEKLKSEITDIVLSNATFKRTSPVICPTFINYFFGNNGTGKSTIAKTIKSGTGVTFKPGKTYDDYDVLLYDQDYINENIKERNDLPGVFTLNKKNADIEDQINSLLDNKDKYQGNIDNANLEIKKLEDKQSALAEQLKSRCWKKTRVIRDEFINTQNGFRKSKQKFLEEVRKHRPKNHDDINLNNLYKTAYSESSRKYNKFNEIKDVTTLDTLTGNNILTMAIVNSSDTQLATFLREIGATEWARQGHDLFQKKAGSNCPYCSQPLDSTFEDSFVKSFDEQYENNWNKLNDYLNDYRNTANQLFIPLEQKPVPLYPNIDIKKYDDTVALIKSTITSNIEKIKSKVNEPSRPVSIGKIEPSLIELSQIIDGYNKAIEKNNEIIASRVQKQQECKKYVFELIANVLKSEISSFDQESKEIQNEIESQQKLKFESSKKGKALISQIEDLNQQTVETETAMQHINMMLKESGFQGFKLIPKKDEEESFGRNNNQSTPTRNYEIVRTGIGQVAKNLSEGERNFIAFMYFLQQVYGKSNASAEAKSKIVIIDDPVTSMDSGTVFIISAEIRKMIEVCRNNVTNRNKLVSGNLIKQIFVFTHNAFFYRNITYPHIRDYQYVSFYLVTKHDNQSMIKLCEKNDPNCPSQKVNVNPVKNSYAALWKEYRETNSSVTLMNVIRRILEYYFLQICGYSGDDIRQKVLIDHKSEFINEKSVDTYKYQLVSSMLAYLSAESVGITDDFLFVDDTLDTDQYRRIFELIFKCMGQEQHFNMMMGV